MSSLYLYKEIDTRYLYLLICFNVLGFPVESGCKSTTFFQTAKIFFQKKSIIFLSVLDDSAIQNEFFFRYTTGTGCKTAKKSPKSPKISPSDGKNRQKTRKTCTIVCHTADKAQKQPQKRPSRASSQHGMSHPGVENRGEKIGKGRREY